MTQPKTADYRNEERKLTAFEAIARARALLDESEDDEPESEPAA